MGQFLWTQFLIFGVPILFLTSVFFINGKLSIPLATKYGVDQLIYPFIFSYSLTQMVGIPDFPPAETLKVLVFLSPVAFLERFVSRGKHGIALALLFNTTLYFVLYPLLEDNFKATLIQWGILNGIFLLLFLAHRTVVGKWLSLLYAFGLLGFGLYLMFVGGSLVLGQAMICTALPAFFMSMYGMWKSKLRLSRMAFHSIAIPVALFAEYYNYGF